MSESQSGQQIELRGTKADLDALRKELRAIDPRIQVGTPVRVHRDESEAPMGAIELYAILIFIGQALVGGMVYDAAKAAIKRLVESRRVSEVDGADTGA